MSNGLTVSAARLRRAAPLAEQVWQDQIVERVFPVLVQGVWRRQRRMRTGDDEQIAQRVRDGAVRWLLRLLMLCYADARGRLPIDGGAGPGDAFEQLRAELGRIGGKDFDDAQRRLSDAFAGGKSGLNDRVQSLLKPLQPLFLAEPVRLPDDCLARAIDGLSRLWLDRAGRPQRIDYRRRTMREWGSAYERLLDAPLKLDASSGKAALRMHQGQSHRKAGGCFYTPEPIVADIVEHSVCAALDDWLAALAEEFRSPRRESAAAREIADRCFEFRVLDPSLGAGYFLVAAQRVIADRMLRFLRRFPDRGVPTKSIMESPCDSASPAAESRREAAWVERRVVEHCLFGIDLDPRAVELARLHLWLESPLELSSLESICRNVRLGDALAEPAPPGFPRAGEFNAVAGNPPYGGLLDAATRRSLVRKLPLMKSNSDTAVGFIERAVQWIRPEGRAGLVVPKPLTYSHAWRGVRALLHRRVERAIDVSRAWPDVRLEQAIVVFRGASRSSSYQAGWSAAGRIVSGPRMSWSLAERFQTLPCTLTAAELKRVARLTFADVAIGDVCRTFRGVPAQRWLAERGETPVIGGRDLERWRIRSVSGYLPRSAPFDLGPFACEKLAFQNIIAHAARPQPHVLLIGAYDLRQTVTLDTVNNLVATDPRVDLRGLCALLHSKLVNWLVYSLVYNKAIRTMHFDQYFLNKIPLPPEWPELLARLAVPAQHSELAAEMLAAPKRGSAESLPQEAFQRLDPQEAARLASQRQQTLDQIERLVAEAYGEGLQS